MVSSVVISFLVNWLGGWDYQLKKGGTINSPPDRFLHLLWLHLLSQPTWLHVRHEPQVTKVTPHLVRTIFSLSLLSSGTDLPSLISPGPQPQPTLTRLWRAVRCILIHSSSALPRRVRCCWSSGWVQDGFVCLFLDSVHFSLNERCCSKSLHLIVTFRRCKS